MNITAHLSHDYKREIDGLRALAVLSVVLFHLGVSDVSGGYVGVDMFFVISGFLISRNIMRAIEEGRFSFFDFYERRVRRLFPAIAFTLVVTFALGTFLLSQEHMQRLSDSSVWALFFFSNHFFFNEAGYFDIDSHFKPLLHTWSLAIEEQYYLLWPAFLMLILGFKTRLYLKRFALPILIVVGLASLAASQVMLKINQDAAFYLLPFRVFEFVIGALCVWGMRLKPQSNLMLEALCITGLILCLYSALFYTDKQPFPGVAALVPCLGAALVILGGSAKYCGLIFRNRIAVGVGLISYSFYLIHWPLIVFYKYGQTADLKAFDQVLIFAASVLVATFMYFFIEMPFRKKPSDARWHKKPSSYALMGAFILLLLAPRLAEPINERSWRLPADVKAALKDTEGLRIASEALRVEREESGFYDRNVARGVIIGDSFANDMLNAIELNTPKYVFKRLVISAECQGYMGRDYIFEGKETDDENGRGCIKTYQDLLHSDDFKNSEVVVFSPYWQPKGVPDFISAVDGIRTLTDAPIVVFGPKMAYDHAPTLVAKYMEKFVDYEGFAEFVIGAQHVIYLTQILEELQTGLADKDVIFVNIFDVFCDGFKCPVLSADNGLVVYDNHHWTVEGARMFGAALKDSGHRAAAAIFKSE